MPSYFENRQLIAQGLAEKEVKVKERKPLPRATKPIAKRSEKMKGIMAAIKPLYKTFLDARPICEIRSETCIGQATEVHHAAGRAMNRILDTTTWLASCTACNLFVENNDAWARENGFKISRHKKNLLGHERI